MVQTTMNLFDLGVIAIIGLSALLSFFRGFVREVISLGAWIGAAVITLYSFQTVSDYVGGQVHNPALAGGIAAIGVFIISLVLISILMGLVLKFLKTGSDVGILDNMIGLMFGVARGVLVVSIFYFVMTLVMAPKDYPIWVKQAATRPYVAAASHYVSKLAPDYLSSISGKKSAEKDDGKEEKEEKSEDGKSKKSLNLPSMEELQKRMREENEKILKENP